MGDRLSIAGTILLTAVAFETYVSSLLPNVPYLTLIEKYLVATNIYIGVVMILMAYDAYIVTYKCKDLVDCVDYNTEEKFTLISIALLSIITIGFLITFVHHNYEEKKKLNKFNKPYDNG